MSAKKAAVIAVLTAAALVIFIIEAQLPPLVPAIPGVKLGLANVITLFTLRTLGRREAFTVTALRVIIGGIYAGGVMRFIYSAAGAFVCCAAMSAVTGVLKGGNRTWFVSVIGAIGHNAGQICAAVALTRTAAVVWYFPVLTVSGIITGVFTGLCVQAVLLHGGGTVKKMMSKIK